MEKSVLIVQRFYYNFREGFFDYLYDINYKFKLINATASRGKVKVHDDAKNKTFIEKTCYFFWGEKYVIFPFLFFKLISINPEIIITEGGANTINNIQIFLYCIVIKRKYIIWDLGKGFADFGNSLLRRLYMRIYAFILKHADYIYGYNTLSKSYFLSLGIEENKLVILNNTIDTRKIRKIRSSYISKTPDELTMQAEKGYIFLIYVGALVKSKNIESLSELMKMLGDKYYLIIVGEGTPKYKSELEKLFGSTNHIFVGYKKIEQLLPYYDLSSFSLLPGLGGLSINQSMAFGVPVICRSADGAEMDLIINDKTGFVYKDIKDAYDYIISKTHDDWKRMGHAANKFLYTNHSVESMMEKFISFL